MSDERQHAPHVLATNRLLAALPPAEFERIAPHLEIQDLAAGTSIAEAGESMSHVYFPLSGVVSVVAAMADGGIIEVGTIGREGMAGLALFHGTDRSPLTTIIQVPGSFARLSAAMFREAARDGTALHQCLHCFAQAYSILVAISGACNRLHSVEQRCARWLLLTHDRAGADSFALTHEFLGYMLGVSRPAVSIAAGALQGAGLLTYHRGVVTILDRPALEATACECYGTIRDEFDRLLG